MRLLLFIIALPLGASSIINSTSVQTTCLWIPGIPPRPDITVSDSSQSGSTSVSCPAGYAGPGASASSTVSGADASATSQVGMGPRFATAQAKAGFEYSAVAPQDGSLALDFVTSWHLIQDSSSTQMSVIFYFDGVQIGGFTQSSPFGGHDTFPQQTITHFVEPVHAGEAYTFAAQAEADTSGSNFAFSTVEVQTAIPEPATIFLVGLVGLGYCLLRATSIL